MLTNIPAAYGLRKAALALTPATPEVPLKKPLAPRNATYVFAGFKTSAGTMQSKRSWPPAPPLLVVVRWGLAYRTGPVARVTTSRASGVLNVWPKVAVLGSPNGLNEVSPGMMMLDASAGRARPADGYRLSAQPARGARQPGSPLTSPLLEG